jgi:hypothetical protein
MTTLSFTLDRYFKTISDELDCIHKNEVMNKIAYSLKDSFGLISLKEIAQSLKNCGNYLNVYCDECECLIPLYRGEYEEILCRKCEEEEYLPLGAEILPLHFKQFLIRWNKEIKKAMGSWGEKGVKAAFLAANPELAMTYEGEYHYMKETYAKDIEAVKVYQKELLNK